LESLKDWARNEGYFITGGSGGDGGLRSFVEDRIFEGDGSRSLFNTGAGLKYTDVTAEAAGIGRVG